MRKSPFVHIILNIILCKKMKADILLYRVKTIKFTASVSSASVFVKLVYLYRLISMHNVMEFETKRILEFVQDLFLLPH